MRMRNDNVLIEMLETQRETVLASGIVLPTALEKPDPTAVVKARVLSVDQSGGYRLRNGRGPLVPNDVEPGQVVLVAPTAGDIAQDYGLDHETERQNEGTGNDRIRIVRHDEILAVVEP